MVHYKGFMEHCLCAFNLVIGCSSKATFSFPEMADDKQLLNMY